MKLFSTLRGQRLASWHAPTIPLLSAAGNEPHGANAPNGRQSLRPAGADDLRRVAVLAIVLCHLFVHLHEVPRAGPEVFFEPACSGLDVPHDDPDLGRFNKGWIAHDLSMRD